MEIGMNKLAHAHCLGLWNFLRVENVMEMQWKCCSPALNF